MSRPAGHRRGRWLVAAVGLGACGTDGAPSARATDRAAAPPAATATATAPASDGAAACTLADRWLACFVEKRLENSGLVPTLVDSAAALPMFSVPARHYRLGRGELYVLLYPDQAAREADVATLDSARVSRRGQPPHAWPVPPQLFTSVNAAAVLLTSSEHLAVRIDDIFSAGLPTLRRR